MAASRAVRALLGVAVIGAVFGLSLVGIASLGATTAPASPTAHLSAATLAACVPAVQFHDAPAVLHVGVPMSGTVSAAFSGPSAAVCSQSAHVTVVGLPIGCPVESSSTFQCTPVVAGTYHVQTTVVALNTATTIVTTAVVL